MAAEALEIPLAINVAAVFVGALGGAVRAGDDERVGIVGVLTLATVMGFGGGIIRDILLGNLPPAVLQNPWYVASVVLAAAIGAFFLYYLRKLGKALWVLDSLSIGLFASVGTNAALIAGLTILPAVLIGTLASVGGLILTDMFQGRPSSIMHQGPPNAAAGLAGAFA
ncbi:MAG: TRIC cation channel family protein, partial [Actinomycetota bacterium]